MSSDVPGSVDTPPERDLSPEAWPVLVDLGATVPDRNGYDLHACIVQMPLGDTRLRFTLRRRGEVLKRFLVTGYHAMQIPALLAQPSDAKEVSCSSST